VRLVHRVGGPFARSALTVGAVTVFVTLVVREPWLVTGHVRADEIPHFLGLIAHGELVILFDWRYWLVLGLLGVLELRYPARPDEGLFSVGAAQDLVWLLVAPLFLQTVVRAWYGVLLNVHEHLLSGITLDVGRVVGSTGAVLLAVVIYDFLGWLSHVIRHRSPSLWSFHAVHHSQRAMSPLADKRVHFMETIVLATLATAPMILLGLSARTGGLIVLALIAHSAFTHSNIRTDLGPLRGIVVTPQSHRVHHSILPEHADTNFGVVLLVWDRLFGTYSAARGEYPATGIVDAQFPLEQSARPAALVRTLTSQVVHPFASIGRRLRATFLDSPAFSWWQARVAVNGRP
jgi:sterol desaturase/sphingolipid hydroxylase (fatty acid hydroxylase superfamily)